MESYEELLEKAEKELPEKIASGERFVVDKVMGHLEGNKTIISNLKKIASQVSRPIEHLLKYLQKELATPGKIADERVIFGTRLSSERINKKIKQYINEFVLCAKCGKPDTQLILIKDIQYLKCLACGSQRLVERIK